MPGGNYCLEVLPNYLFSSSHADIFERKKVFCLSSHDQGDIWICKQCQRLPCRCCLQVWFMRPAYCICYHTTRKVTRQRSSIFWGLQLILWYFNCHSYADFRPCFPSELLNTSLGIAYSLMVVIMPYAIFYPLLSEAKDAESTESPRGTVGSTVKVHNNFWSTYHVVSSKSEIMKKVYFVLAIQLYGGSLSTVSFCLFQNKMEKSFSQTQRSTNWRKWIGYRITGVC